MSTPSLASTDLDREAWLTNLASLALESVIAPALRAFSLPSDTPYRVSIGCVPGQRQPALARTLPRSLSTDGTSEIFVSPTLDSTNQEQIAALLAHELIHAALDTTKHDDNFRRVAKRAGFLAPIASAVPGRALQLTLADLAALVGPLPHAAIDYHALPKQTTRMLKLQCTQCHSIYRASASTIRNLTNPAYCPAGCGKTLTV